MSDHLPQFGVLFDVGWTLLDEGKRLRAALEWLSGALAKRGLLRSAEELDGGYRAACRAPTPGEPSLIVQQLVALGVPVAEARRLRKELPWDAVPLEPFPDSADCLRRLRSAGFRVGVLANQPASARDDLARCGLLEHCDDVWLSDAVGLAKPDPAFFRLALDAWGLPPQRVAYVGDRPDNDVAPSKRLGLFAVRVLLGMHADQPARGAEQEADAVAPTLAAAAESVIAWRNAAGGGGTAG
jgi:HAD superfamily hydrolase (TIGR01509 family)